MRTYSEFRPSQFDSHITIEGQEDWFVVPCAKNRDSDCLAESNYEVALKMLGGESDTVETHSFTHWACGEFSIILVKPNTDACKIAEEIEASLSDYPVLDESDFSEKETEAANLTWKQCYSNKERIEYIREHESQFEFHSFADMLNCVRGNYFLGYASELLG